MAVSDKPTLSNSSAVDTGGFKKPSKSMSAPFADFIDEVLRSVPDNGNSLNIIA